MNKFSIPTPQDIQDEAQNRGWSIKRLCDEADFSTETFFRWRDGKHIHETHAAVIKALAEQHGVASP